MLSPHKTLDQPLGIIIPATQFTNWVQGASDLSGVNTGPVTLKEIGTTGVVAALFAANSDFIATFMGKPPWWPTDSKVRFRFWWSTGSSTTSQIAEFQLAIVDAQREGGTFSTGSSATAVVQDNPLTSGDLVIYSPWSASMGSLVQRGYNPLTQPGFMLKVTRTANTTIVGTLHLVALELEFMP